MSELLGHICAGNGSLQALGVDVLSKKQGGLLSCFVLLLLCLLQLLRELFLLCAQLLERGRWVHARALCSCSEKRGCLK